MFALHRPYQKCMPNNCVTLTITAARLEVEAASERVASDTRWRRVFVEIVGDAAGWDVASESTKEAALTDGARGYQPAGGQRWA
jgi:hypothetical protein